ncbi:hypothetical protein TYRP_016335 [Tyrophagus putrescentiae]|nr:hypothetical protein TYRP_016335 [Tyrophagus putrescentiae]
MSCSRDFSWRVISSDSFFRSAVRAWPDGRDQRVQDDQLSLDVADLGAMWLLGDSSFAWLISFSARATICSTVSARGDVRVSGVVDSVDLFANSFYYLLNNVNVMKMVHTTGLSEGLLSSASSCSDGLNLVL